ncbi:zinc ABC transporter substrate-binding protein [Oricola cellulosilytica]|uniref:High-affinity zinc uptake system protein ZnuA n=1 Tax=Oricola cellulosilytica TaxID=1429082 RepID=A0A4V2MP45_9HYPH|nr:zinc ABC transporter substrate-binding protein [Oricola cellulosilytica]TCD16272.1 zinc ABC transporter substrate-binding protein [Oricola cellulosilytica]
MPGLRTLVAAVIALFLPYATASAEVAVATSIKPVHSLVAAVMEGVGTPALLVDGAGSPHSYSLKPSQAAALENAEVIFWVGPALESFLAKPLATIAAEARVTELMEVEGQTLLGFREGGEFESHDDAEGPEHSANDPDMHAEEGAFNPHIWLDPRNAIVLVEQIETVLSEVDPEQATQYQANANKIVAKLESLTEEIGEMLEAAREGKFIVFHDAYRYFEERFDIHATGSVTVSPEVAPGAARIAEIKGRIRETETVCVFSEPQFEPKLIATLIADTNAKSGVLDPLGAGLADGPELYFELMRNMATTLVDCLADRG